jgi:hypothetical protein
MGWEPEERLEKIQQQIETTVTREFGAARLAVRTEIDKEVTRQVKAALRSVHVLDLRVGVLCLSVDDGEEFGEIRIAELGAQIVQQQGEGARKWKLRWAAALEAEAAKIRASVTEPEPSGITGPFAPPQST